MTHIFDIQEIQFDIHLIESIGSKEKYWYRDDDDQRFLFKAGREGTGENWAELITSCLAELLNIPHAQYRPAKYVQKLGTSCISFVDKGTLVHGNEILYNHDPLHYPHEPEKIRRIPEYTLIDTLSVNNQEKLYPPIGFNPHDLRVKNAIDIFIGYLLFDTWIGNTDRHHQNWGWILHETDNRISLAPTFDHASSLGRELLDSERSERMTTKDRRRTIELYAAKASTPFYGDPAQNHPLSTYRVAELVIESFPNASKYWIEGILDIRDCQIEKVFDKIPTEFISIPSRDFAVKLLDLNKDYLKDLYFKIL